MANLRDLTGYTVGQLRVIAFAKMVNYAGRSQTSWLCECHCGTQLVLAYDKIPVTARQRQTMMKSGRRLYTCCESCREKICPVCGTHYSYSHTSHICPNPDCKATITAERIRYHAITDGSRRRADVLVRDAVNSYQRGYYNKNAGAIKAKRKTAQLTDEAKQRRAEQRKRWYEELKADPLRYAKWLEDARRRKQDRRKG